MYLECLLWSNQHDHFGHFGKFTQFTSPEAIKFTSSDSRKAPCRAQDPVSRYPPPQHPATRARRHQGQSTHLNTPACPLYEPDLVSVSNTA